METKESPTLQLDSLRNQGEGQETEEETSSNGSNASP